MYEGLSMIFPSVEPYIHGRVEVLLFLLHVFSHRSQSNVFFVDAATRTVVSKRSKPLTIIKSGSFWKSTKE